MPRVVPSEASARQRLPSRACTVAPTSNWSPEPNNHVLQVLGAVTNDENLNVNHMLNINNDIPKSKINCNGNPGHIIIMVNINNV